MDDSVSYTQVKTKRYEISSQFNLARQELLDVAPGAASHLEIQSLLDHHFAGEIYKLRTWILAGWHEPINDWIDVPDGWFQHLKQDLNWSWLLRRWPVRMRRIEFQVTGAINVCPHINMESRDACIEFLAAVPRREGTPP